MAAQFLDQLVKIPKRELSKDSYCMICHRDYGTDSLDAPVRLPCNHDVGFECISIWLSREAKNSCPMCRRVFFDVVEEDDEEDEDEDEEEEEEEERYREILRRVGQPPQEGLARGHAPRLYNAWYDYFVQAAAEQYQESLIRARVFVVGDFAGRSHSTVEELRSHTASQATAFRTLAVREMILYNVFRRDAGLPPLEGPIRAPLNEEQLEALFQELRQRGAFEIDLHPFENYHGLTDREMWLLHRDEGESYSTQEGGFWSLSLP